MIRAIVTDIEGTTSDIRFVHNVLFPYARERLPAFLNAQQYIEPVKTILDNLREEIAQPDATTADLLDTLLQFIDEDRKSTPLKALQGIIWRDGYVNGDFTGHLYPDVLPALEKWKAQGIDLYVYSSGSVAAQKLLFGYSDEGDITHLFSGYFDTLVGAKREEQSYRNIAEQLGIPAAQILFLSDIHQELDAAEAAGLRTVQLIRGDNDAASHHHQVSSFDHIKPEQIPS
ncbi:TPA: acireductone synthase [Kluyvera intermedia]|jgi:enolase-phosphatase E1|uniref:Enolase-phosphatase E1 n=1 Tax=Kluyvera intermedia TaxID=61648 RepID=A0ABX3UH72_KLUIN|nr:MULTISPECIES: acireductone synthase [Enterobacteriaceae]MDU6683111.1 acireductone synthase [Enterobacteriaceae bacterium]MCL9672045.1 acireductone synthase [Citrobacter sp. MNAZ 1397]ORJ50250.1 acireductone synthase [Kluyvera intermedia]HAT2608290.1 acireductone synthase [Kluyvera intermedia]HAU8263839.1 acireductone synthase [Kluyvera intermedia]